MIEARIVRGQAVRQIDADTDQEQREQLKVLWENEKISLSKIERILDIDRKIIRREAIRLGLSPYRSKKDEEIFKKQRLHHRGRWLRVLKEHPSLRISGLLKKKNRSLYEWLRFNDIDWLQEHLPMNDKGSNTMLQNFGGFVAIQNDGTTTILEPVQSTRIYENIPLGTVYIVLYSDAYWEIQGK